VRFPEVRDRMVGTLDELEAILMHSVVDEVLIALPIKSHYGKIEHVIEACESAGVQSRYSADVFRARLARPRFEATAPYPTVAMKVACDDHRLAIKRVIDTMGAGVGLLMLSPLLVAIAVVIQLTSPGPVLYRQERYGLRKRRFHMLKFRTMVADADALQAGLESRNEAQGPLFKISHDPRVTRVGRFLRKTSLDELPQLWNVFMGDMSLVGPRPLPLRDVSRFSEGWLMRRFSVTPGMTGLWQVSGRSCLDFQQCAALDLEYIDQWSLALDLKILLRTVPAVIRMVGAS
jgi:exopolysaccharide biosynthesis polyprenyl glycosylphosphotransferase